MKRIVRACLGMLLVGCGSQAGGALPSDSAAPAGVTPDIEDTPDVLGAIEIVQELDASPGDDAAEVGTMDAVDAAEVGAPDSVDDAAEVDCDDANPCTVDKLVAGGCVHTPKVCYDGDSCTIDSCVGFGHCEYVPKSCDDGEACTVDSCTDGVCSSAPKDCDDGDPCTLNDACESGQCVSQPKDCDDGHPCTQDSCTADGTCESSDESCDDGEPCTQDACDPGMGCLHEPVDCDDGDACTQDHCYSGLGCTHVTAPTETCGGSSACTGCPTWDGFACVSDEKGEWCENAETQEVWVPPGIAWVGCNPLLADCGSLSGYSGVQAPIYVAGFAIGKTEWTTDQHAAKGYTPTLQGGSAEDSTYTYTGYTPGHPANYIGGGYCNSPPLRRCHEFEWEKAARGGCAHLGCAEDDEDCCKPATPIWPWGLEGPDCTKAWYGMCGGGETHPVGTKPAGRSPYGAMDMAGSVVEGVMNLVGIGNDEIAEMSDFWVSEGASCCGGDLDSFRGGGPILETGPITSMSTFARYSASLPFEPSNGTGARCCRDVPPAPEAP